jgi:glucose-1-phosphate thymidylyltransferase
VAPGDPKHLIPVANRPILFHNLEALRAAGVLEATLLVEPGAGQAIESAVGDGREWGIGVRYDEWEPEEGVSGALAVGNDFLRGEPVLVLQGDALLRERMHRHTAAFAREGLDAMALQLRHLGNGKVPVHEPGYLLSSRAVSFLLDGRDPCPMAGVRARGGRVRIEPVDGVLPCHGSQELLLEGNRRMLEVLEPSVEPRRLRDCTIQGTVSIHPTARVTRSLLRGPLIVGPGAHVTDAYIGPYTSVGARVVIEGSEIEHSIVLSDAELRFVGTRLESSVIGRGARIVRGFDLPGAIQMSVGEGAVVILR